MAESPKPYAAQRRKSRLAAAAHGLADDEGDVGAGCKIKHHGGGEKAGPMQEGIFKHGGRLAQVWALGKAAPAAWRVQ